MPPRPRAKFPTYSTNWQSVTSRLLPSACGHYMVCRTCLSHTRKTPLPFVSTICMLRAYPANRVVHSRIYSTSLYCIRYRQLRQEIRSRPSWQAPQARFHRWRLVFISSCLFSPVDCSVLCTPFIVGVVQTTKTGFSYNGESNLDLQYGMALVTAAQKVTLYQVGDLVECQLFFCSIMRGKPC
jgi:hypothetical protein